MLHLRFVSPWGSDRLWLIIPTLCSEFQVVVPSLDCVVLRWWGLEEESWLLRITCTISLFHLNLDTNAYLGFWAFRQPSWKCLLRVSKSASFSNVCVSCLLELLRILFKGLANKIVEVATKQSTLFAWRSWRLARLPGRRDEGRGPDRSPRKEEKERVELSRVAI